MGYKLLKGTYTVPISQLSVIGNSYGPPDKYLDSRKLTDGYNRKYTVYQTMFFNVCDIFGLSVMMHGYGDTNDENSSYNLEAAFFVKAAEAPDSIKPVHFMGYHELVSENIRKHFYKIQNWYEPFRHTSTSAGPVTLTLSDMLEYSLIFNKLSGYGNETNTINKLKELAETSGAYFEIVKQTSNISNWSEFTGQVLAPKFPCSKFSLVVPNNSYSAEEVNEIINNTNLIKTNIDNIDIQSRYNKVQYAYNLGVSNYSGYLESVEHLRSSEAFRALDDLK